MDLKRYLPEPIYGPERHVEDLQDALGEQVGEAQNARDDLFGQLRPATATWGLAEYEREFGILPDETTPRDERLAELRARRRGRGTTTKEMVKTVAESYAERSVTIEEHPDEFLFEVNFGAGIPIGLDKLRVVLDEIKPAHLDYRLSARRTIPAELRTAASLARYRLDAVCGPEEALALFRGEQEENEPQRLGGR